MGEANRKKADKKKIFESDPDRFIDGQEVVMCVRVTNEGLLEYMINSKKAGHFPAAIGQLIVEVPFVAQYAKAQMKTQNNRVIKPGGNGKLNT